MKTKKTVLKDIMPILLLEFHYFDNKISGKTTFEELKSDKLINKELLSQIEELYQIIFPENIVLKKIDDILIYLVRVL